MARTLFPKTVRATSFPLTGHVPHCEVFGLVHSFIGLHMHLEATDQQFLRPDDLHLFNEGTQLRLYEKLGAHLLHDGRRAGAHFAVWAPHAEHLSVIGDFNDWDKEASQLTIQGSSG